MIIINTIAPTTTRTTGIIGLIAIVLHFVQAEDALGLPRPPDISVCYPAWRQKTAQRALEHPPRHRLADPQNNFSALHLDIQEHNFFQ